MIKKTARLVITALGMAAGAGIWVSVIRFIDSRPFLLPGSYHDWVNPLAYIVASLLFGIIFFLIAPFIINGFSRLIRSIEKRLAKISMSDIVPGVMGLIVGLLISYLLSGLIKNSPASWLTFTITALIYITFAFLGIRIAVNRKNEISFGSMFEGGKGKHKALHPLVLDTSVIIDGRIYDICKTGIIDGTLVIPDFVLVELRHIADSADDLKRSRGRRGLDVLNMIQKELDLNVVIRQTDYEDSMEVDSKLLKLAHDLGGKIVTNDFNLNKVATVQGVGVVNINDFANAVKPIALPGETMTVTIIKDGKEPTQGIAYLDDGTMIVVEDGKGKVGKTFKVIVTSVLQTSAGRMIFARIA
jgi:uncharacterized protein YacL